MKREYKFIVLYDVDDYRCEGGGLHSHQCYNLNDVKAFIKYCKNCNSLVSSRSYHSKRDIYKVLKIRNDLDHLFKEIN